MNRVQRAAVILAGSIVLACGPAPTEEPEPEVPQAPVAAAAPAPPPPPPVPTGATDESTEAPPPDQWTQQYPNGQWVYGNGYGWMWVPNEGGAVVVEETPYVYLYTPTYGWTWYVSPWGYGPYHYGLWVRRPWRPAGWRYGWVARPGVTVHIRSHYYGGGRGHYGGGHSRGGGRHR